MAGNQPSWRERQKIGKYGEICLHLKTLHFPLHTFGRGGNEELGVNKFEVLKNCTNLTITSGCPLRRASPIGLRQKEIPCYFPNHWRELVDPIGP